MLDIIVTTYNRRELFSRTMSSFFATTDLEKVRRIIISNDGSTDGTEEDIRDIVSQFPNKVAVLLRHEDRMGLIPRFNMAHGMCSCDIICEFQDDVQFSEGWLEEQIPLTSTYDFVTGYDAREHRPFANKNGHLVKHSSRFTQLMARKSVWDRYFPMKSNYDFPTPSRNNGNSVGSKIDVNLFGGRINNPRGRIKFAVVPGKVLHRAEYSNSTWREGLSEDSYKKGGLRPYIVKSYWKNRHNAQSVNAVGYANKSSKVQAQILKQKKDFIFDHVPSDMRTVDFGCGVGAFSAHFTKSRYLGIDVTEGFIGHARKKNPDHAYRIVDAPVFNGGRLRSVLQDLGMEMELFFTSNVLQHNCDFTVSNVFKEVRKVKEEGFIFAMYENTNTMFKNTRHMCFRNEGDYVAFISDCFDVKHVFYNSHTVHGEKHSIIMVSV